MLEDGPGRSGPHPPLCRARTEGENLMVKWLMREYRELLTMARVGLDRDRIAKSLGRHHCQFMRPRSE